MTGEYDILLLIHVLFLRLGSFSPKQLHQSLLLLCGPQGMGICHKMQIIEKLLNLRRTEYPMITYLYLFFKGTEPRKEFPYFGDGMRKY